MSEKLGAFGVIIAVLSFVWWGRPEPKYVVVRARYPVELLDVTTAIQTETTWRGSYFTDSHPQKRLGKVGLSITERVEPKPDVRPELRRFGNFNGVLTLTSQGRDYEFPFDAKFSRETQVHTAELEFRYKAPRRHPLSVYVHLRDKPLPSEPPPPQIPMVPAKAELRLERGQLVGKITDADKHLCAWVALEPEFPIRAIESTP